MNARRVRSDSSVALSSELPGACSHVTLASTPIFDQASEHAHCLSRDAAVVWRACDGTLAPEQIATTAGIDLDTVMRALDELDERDLLVTRVGVTRREVTVRLAKAGGAAAAAPLIYSIIAPTPALGASQTFCTSQGCQNGCGGCKAFGCACCGPGGGNTKLSTADCSTANCNPAIINAFHCGTPVTSVVCNT